MYLLTLAVTKQLWQKQQQPACLPPGSCHFTGFAQPLALHHAIQHILLAAEIQDMHMVVQSSKPS